MTSIFTAATPEDYGAFAELVREYALWLRDKLAEESWFIQAVLKHQSLEQELNSLPVTYGPPHGKVLLARNDGLIAGGVAYREHASGVCEMKRMFVRDRFRSQGIGRQLCRAVIAAATADGYRLMLLDTSRRLTETIALYRSFGFSECSPYRDYPLELMPHLLFMEMPLGTNQ